MESPKLTERFIRFAQGMLPQVTLWIVSVGFLWCEPLAFATAPVLVTPTPAEPGVHSLLQQLPDDVRRAIEGDGMPERAMKEVNPSPFEEEIQRQLYSLSAMEKTLSATGLHQSDVDEQLDRVEFVVGHHADLWKQTDDLRKQKIKLEMRIATLEEQIKLEERIASIEARLPKPLDSKTLHNLSEEVHRYEIGVHDYEKAVRLLQKPSKE